MISTKVDFEIRNPAPGISAKSMVFGDVLHMVRFQIAKGSHMPSHTHIHEQAGYLIQGRLIMSIDGVDYELKSGDAWAIRANVPHSVEMVEDGLIVEVFSPIREDYLPDGESR